MFGISLKVAAMSLLLAFVGVFVLMFLIDLVLVREPGTAAAKTSRRVGGLVLGSGTVGVSAAVAGLDVLAQVPEMGIALLGIGSIIAGVSWEMFAAGTLVLYVILEAVTPAEG